MTPVIIILIIVGVIALWAIVTYNRFITFKNRTTEAWADIDVQLKRRYDLIPNLINTVKGYAAHESQTLEKVIQARNTAMQNQGATEQHAAAENMLSGTLKSLFALSENYPDLKANTNFLELQRELSDTENKIQAARRFYNGNVRDFTTALQVFPSNIIGNAFSFKAPAFFEIAEGSVESQPVEVKF